jgi:cell division protease FtsH
MPTTRFNPSHLDKTNLERLEKMFYLKNTRYHPMRNRILFKYNVKMVNETQQNVNITRVLEDINNEFIKSYKEQIELEVKEDEELENEIQKALQDEIEDDLNDNELGDVVDDADEKENNRKNNPDGYMGDDGIFRYKNGNIGRLIISTNQNTANSGGSSGNDNFFQIVKDNDFSFKDVGGYDKIKDELMQTADMLTNYSKYKKYNVRTPKGIIFEGPPGNGKTLLAKGFSGELNVSFIPVSGSEFAEKYVGVGASRIRELFQLAEQNIPSIIFIDEIDALGRKRGNDDSSNSEKDQTLNQLLISLDGFKSSEGIFVIGATNRADLLDSALTRPGRMDKQIYIGNPDSETREAIIRIHSEGKPMELDISIKDLVETTGGFSGAQIENLLNEAMLYSLRDEREIISKNDLEFILNRIYAGWQTKESKYSDDIIERIVIHEMGHAIVGFLSKEHSKLAKVTLNLWSPKTPGYTIFENGDEDSNIYTKNGLFDHLMVLLAGRIAEEVIFGYSVTTGARQDLEQAFGLAKNMIINYGMGKQNIYPDMSDHSKYLIDQEVNKMLMMANDHARLVILKSKQCMLDCAEILKRDKILKPEQIVTLIDEKYPEIWNAYEVKKRYVEDNI